MDAPEKQMSLPARQQLILDEIEHVLGAADPHLKSMFAAFGRLGPQAIMPAAEIITRRSMRRLVTVSVILISMLGLIAINVVSTSRDCPGLPSDQVVASAAVRYAGCTHSTDVWSKGAR
jgi:hypothetical protein